MGKEMVPFIYNTHTHTHAPLTRGEGTTDSCVSPSSRDEESPALIALPLQYGLTLPLPVDIHMMRAEKNMGFCSISNFLPLLLVFG